MSILTAVLKVRKKKKTSRLLSRQVLFDEGQLSIIPTRLSR